MATVPAELKPEVDAIVEAIVYLYTESRRLTKDVAARHGLTGPQLTVVKMLEALGDLSLSRLSEKIRAQNSTVTGIVDRMEREGLVVRTRSATDRRVVHIQLTEKGTELASEVKVEPIAIFRDALSSLSRDEMRDLLRILTKLAQRVKTIVERPLPASQQETTMTQVRNPDVVVVTCALTGVLANRKQCPGIPYTPEEIGEEARRAYEAGASCVHIHARNDDGSPTFSPAVFARIKEEVRKRSPVILNYSTGTILDDVTDQCTYLRESKPEIGALNMGTMNYSKYSEKRKEMVFDMIFPNTYGKIIKLLETMNAAGVKPELECFDSGHTNGIGPLLHMGVLKPPLQFSFIVNVLGGIPPMVESLQLQTKIMPPGSEWEVIGISTCQWRMLATALVLGGNIRCGLEDNLYLPNGEMAKSNGELVEVAVRMTRDIGRRPATVEEARQILSLGPPT